MVTEVVSLIGILPVTLLSHSSSSIKPKLSSQGSLSSLECT